MICALHFWYFLYKFGLHMAYWAAAFGGTSYTPLHQLLFFPFYLTALLNPWQHQQQRLQQCQH